MRPGGSQARSSADIIQRAPIKQFSGDQIIPSVDVRIGHQLAGRIRLRREVEDVHRSRSGKGELLGFTGRDNLVDVAALLTWLSRNQCGGEVERRLGTDA